MEREKERERWIGKKRKKRYTRVSRTWEKLIRGTKMYIYKNAEMLKGYLLIVNSIRNRRIAEMNAYNAYTPAVQKFFFFLTAMTHGSNIKAEFEIFDFSSFKNFDQQKGGKEFSSNRSGF